MLDFGSKPGVRLTFGLQPHHIKTIEDELERWNKTHNTNVPEDEITDPRFMKYIWERVGHILGWEPFTLALFYFEYLEEQRAAAAKTSALSEPTPIQEEEEDDAHEPEACSVCGAIDGRVNPCCSGYDPLDFKNAGYG